MCNNSCKHYSIGYTVIKEAEKQTEQKMKYFAFTMKNGTLRIESGLNFVNATQRFYPDFDIASTIELEKGEIVTDEDYGEIVTDEDYGEIVTDEDYGEIVTDEDYNLQ